MWPGSIVPALPSSPRPRRELLEIELQRRVQSARAGTKRKDGPSSRALVRPLHDRSQQPTRLGSGCYDRFTTLLPAHGGTMNLEVLAARVQKLLRLTMWNLEVGQGCYRRSSGHVSPKEQVADSRQGTDVGPRSLNPRQACWDHRLIPVLGVMLPPGNLRC